MPKSRPRIPKENKVRAELQLEINSQCPFCMSKDVGHFEVHHIDENPSNNSINNLLLLCPTCHSKITKGDISKESVILKKKNIGENVEYSNLSGFFLSQEVFQKELKRLLSKEDSVYYTELREHWNSYSLITECSFLNELINKSLPKSIEFGLLPLISDYVSNHLYNDKDAKYLYNQPHIYMHNSEDEGYNLPVYYHIRLVGILYATAICNKVDIDIISQNYKNMQSIFSSIIEGIINNLKADEIDNNKEYPTNYHWLIGEIFSITNNWFRQFNELENFVKTSSYVDYISSCTRWCFSELYKGVQSQKIDKKFMIQQFYYGILTEYFSPLLNNFLRESIEQNIISQIPDEFVKPILRFSFNEKFAMNYEEFCKENFRVVNSKEREILKRLRMFLLDNNKI